MVALHVAEEPAPPDYVRSTAIDPHALDDLYGPFSSRRDAREALRGLAAEARLCWTALGLERRKGPCFARQVRKCAGACVSAETPEAHHARLREVLAKHALKRWPFAPMVGVRETSFTRDRTEIHVLSNWCWLGTAREEAELQAILEAPPRVEFDLDIYRLLAKRLPKSQLVALG